jgi:hypothetical protein
MFAAENGKEEDDCAKNQNLSDKCSSCACWTPNAVKKCSLTWIAGCGNGNAFEIAG